MAMPSTTPHNPHLPRPTTARTKPPLPTRPPRQKHTASHNALASKPGGNTETFM
ncbi:hypothetical protein HK097_005155, partial [Rhizophlyctis rosea]